MSDSSSRKPQHDTKTVVTHADGSSYAIYHPPRYPVGKMIADAIPSAPNMLKVPVRTGIDGKPDKWFPVRTLGAIVDVTTYSTANGVPPICPYYSRLDHA